MMIKILATLDSNRRKFSQFISLLLVTIFLVGCQGMSQTQRQGTLYGTAGGAAIGAGIGAAIGGGRGALVGAAVGGLVGLIAGQEWAKRIESKRAMYQTEQERLEATIQETQVIQREMHARNLKLQEDIAITQGKIDSLQNIAASQQANHGKLKSLVAEIEKRKKKTAKLKSELERTMIAESDALEAARAQQLDTSRLVTEVDTLRGELLTLQTYEQQLQAMLLRVHS